MLAQLLLFKIKLLPSKGFKFLAKINKLLKSTSGFLESEKLMKDTLQKENTIVHQSKQSTQLELTKELEQTYIQIKILNEDILLLQKSNEDTENLLKAGQPEIYALKIKLIEAGNSIARFKALLSQKQNQ